MQIWLYLRSKRTDLQCALFPSLFVSFLEVSYKTNWCMFYQSVVTRRSCFSLYSCSWRTEETKIDNTSHSRHGRTSVAGMGPSSNHGRRWQILFRDLDQSPPLIGPNSCPYAFPAQAALAGTREVCRGSVLPSWGVLRLPAHRDTEKKFCLCLPLTQETGNITFHHDVRGQKRWVLLARPLVAVLL